MSKPYDRPTNEPGGCDCHECGIVFVGAEEHTLCAICHRIKQAAEAERVAIVAWLRRMARDADHDAARAKVREANKLAELSGVIRQFADAIESGVHLSTEGGL